MAQKPAGKNDKKSVKKKPPAKKSKKKLPVKFDPNDTWSLMEKVIIGGDMFDLTPEERVLYYQAICHSLKLNPLTKPFDYIKLDGKLTLYAKASAAEQLRNIQNISIFKIEDESDDTFFRKIAYGEKADGRKDMSTAVLHKMVYDSYTKKMRTAKPLELANLEMKCETKVKRRLTLSMAGLNMVDESDLDTMQGFQLAKLNAAGEITELSESKALIGADQADNEKKLKEFLEGKEELKESVNRIMKAGRPKSWIFDTCEINDWDADKVYEKIGNELEDIALNKENK